MIYMFSDHLGSTVVTRYQLGNVYRNGYYPFGEERYSSSYTPYQFTGQRKETAIGLYDYHARFYDSSIGRFVLRSTPRPQVEGDADTIVPGPGSPQSWDRYAYVKNNPMRYTDPSGNYYCEGETSGKHNIYHIFTQHKYIEYRINSDYGITLEGEWDTENLRNLLGSINNLESSLGRIKNFTMGTTYSFTKNSTNYGGITSGGNISFHGWRGGIPYQNFYHEVAHAVDNQSNGYFTNQLSAKIITDNDGNYVMGGSTSEYDRNSDGYISEKILDPNGSNVDAQQHPGSRSCAVPGSWCADGNTADEEWADLIANSVSGNFDNDIGMIRKNWIMDVFARYWLTPR